MATATQRRKVKRVMHEFKKGELKAGRGPRGKVKSRRQAVAIALSESGQSYKQRGRKKAARTGRGTPSARRKARSRKTSGR
jgi:hypothetical protein